MADIVGRSAAIGRIDAAMTALTTGARAQCFIVHGLNGSGRSTFLQLAAGAATGRDWLRVGAIGNPGSGAPVALAAIAAIAAELARRRPGASTIARLQEAVQQVIAHPDRPCPYLGEELTEALETARCGVLVTFDDAPGSGAELDSLAAPTEAGLPFLALIVPPVGSVGSRRSDRYDVIEMGPLNHDELTELLQRAHNGADAAQLAQLSGGWPWIAAALADTDAARWPEVMVSLGARVLGCLTGSERRYVTAVANLGPGPVQVAMVARALGDTTRFSSESSALVGVRDALTAKGVLYQPDPLTVDLAVAGAALVLTRR